MTQINKFGQIKYQPDVYDISFSFDILSPDRGEIILDTMLFYVDHGLFIKKIYEKPYLIMLSPFFHLLHHFIKYMSNLQNTNDHVAILESVFKHGNLHLYYGPMFAKIATYKTKLFFIVAAK